MSRYAIIITGVGTAALALGVSRAEADILRWTFGGTVGPVPAEPAPGVLADLEEGMDYSLSYTFDTSSTAENSEFFFAAKLAFLAWGTEGVEGAAIELQAQDVPFEVSFDNDREPLFGDQPEDVVDIFVPAVAVPDGSAELFPEEVLFSQLLVGLEEALDSKGFHADFDLNDFPVFQSAAIGFASPTEGADSFIDLSMDSFESIIVPAPPGAAAMLIGGAGLARRRRRAA